MHVKTSISIIVLTFSIFATGISNTWQVNNFAQIKPGVGVMAKGIYREFPYLYDKDNSFKAYMDYRTITDISSEQWRMQLNAYTDEYGMRKIGEYYCIALGSGICNKIGTKFEITLNSGKKFKAILADQKADVHTDQTNTYIPMCEQKINIVEFIVQDDALPQIVREMGDINNMPDDMFNGQITNIKELIN